MLYIIFRMSCINLLNEKLKNHLLKDGYRIRETCHQWGIELIIEGKGEIVTIDIYNSNHDNYITVEISALSNYHDFSVDILECNCIEDINSCLNKVLLSIKRL